MRVTKSATQPYDNQAISELLRRCMTLTYGAIDYGERNGIDNRKGMRGFYDSMKGVDIPSFFKVGVMARASSVIRSREKDLRRGAEARHRKPLKPMVCITSGFSITVTGKLFITQRSGPGDMIQLNRYVQRKVSEGGVKVRSLTITAKTISLCYSREVDPIRIDRVYGVDSNEKNLTFGDREEVAMLDVSRIVRVRQDTREVLSTFHRNDARVRRELSSKHWRRANDRIASVLHSATNFIVEQAALVNAALAMEELTGISRMYRRGNGQGADYRFRLSSWPYRKAKSIIDYKSAWKGVTVVELDKAETRGSSVTHSCGERLREPERGDASHARELFCPRCKVWTNRDVNASVILSDRGLARLASDLPPEEAARLLQEGKGPPGEAMKGKGPSTLLLQVDGGKVTISR